MLMPALIERETFNHPTHLKERVTNATTTMKPIFDVSILTIQEIHSLPDAWSHADYQNILERADFDDWSELDPSELKEYTLLTLQDLEPDEAAELVLKHKFQDRLKDGQIQNMAHEMMEEKLWEEYSDIRFHKELYHCSVLMRAVFPRQFPETDAMKCQLAVSAQHQSGKELIHHLDKPFLARLIAHGMDDHAVINRLFDEQIAGASFAEAESIIWDFASDVAEDKATVTIYSSTYWLHDLNEAPENYSSKAHSDLTDTH